VPSNGGEERPHLVGVDTCGAAARGVGNVDDGVDAVQGGGQPRSGGQVHANRLGEHDRIVPTRRTASTVQWPTSPVPPASAIFTIGPPRVDVCWSFVMRATRPYQRDEGAPAR
jgi:hypothetical protein